MERMITEAAWGYYAFVLDDGVVVEKGKLACFDTANDGALITATSATDLFTIGIFAESMTGDGVKRCQVKLHRELWLTWWDNDAAGTPVAIEDRGKSCNLKDGTTVTMAAGSVAGVVMDVHDTKGVLVYFPMAAPAVAADP